MLTDLFILISSSNFGASQGHLNPRGDGELSVLDLVHVEWCRRCQVWRNPQPYPRLQGWRVWPFCSRSWLVAQVGAYLQETVRLPCPGNAVQAIASGISAAAFAFDDDTRGWVCLGAPGLQYEQQVHLCLDQALTASILMGSSSLISCMC